MSQPLPTMETLFVSRHCMQELLRKAVIAENRPFLGLLAGREGTIERAIQIGSSEQPGAIDTGNLKLMGVFQSADADGCADREQTDFIAGCFEQACDRTPDCYVVLELSHAGRLDAQAFADPALATPIVLEMQEDNNLYHVGANC